MHLSLPRRRAGWIICFFQKSRQEAVVSVSGSQEGMGSHGQINFGPHSSSLSPAGSSGQFESVIKGYSRTLCQITEAGKRVPHTQTPPRSATARSLHSTSRPYRGYVGGPDGPACTVSGCRELPAVSLAPKDHLTRLCDSVCPASSQVQGHPPHSSEGSPCPCLGRGITVLLAKDVMVPVPPADMKAWFFSPYIIVPKKSGGLRPILGLRILNWAFHKPPFKMLMQNRVFGCIRPQVRSAAFDLKDPYFHVSILPCHRPFLRFAFEGRAYQYRSCPSGCP